MRALTPIAVAAALTGLLPAQSDPVILTGKDLPRLLQRPPGRIVAFARGADGWRQIPVQVDERARLPFSQVLRRALLSGQEGLFYTDPDTFTGADPDAGFDADDELVLLAADFGGAAPEDAAPPEHTDAGTRVALRLPGAPDERGHAYLFAGDATLAPGAGRKRVTYRFALESGDYKASYATAKGPNPETSTITTSHYRLGFRDRWIMDELRITAGGAAGADILDRHEVQVAPPSCVRTTATFCAGSGAIVANIDGPVRAIRSVMGANSGPMTERQWVCYPQRFDIVTHLRVHALPSVLMFFDYSADAKGMRMRDNNNPEGFVVDGRPDAHRPGRLEWQELSGAQGSLLIHYLLDTTVEPLRLGSLYDDNLAPVWKQCAGDGHAFGASGPLLTGIPSTDPRHRGARRLESRVVVYPGAPGRVVEAPAPPAPLAVEVR